MKNYSLIQHDINFAGIDIDEDVGKLTTKAKGAIYTSRAGVDGTTTTSENKGNANRDAELEIGYGSKANASLSSFFNLVLAAGGGTAGVAPFVVKDRQGTSLEMTLEAYITGWPDAERAAETGIIVWKFELVQPKMFLGGLPG